MCDDAFSLNMSDCLSAYYLLALFAFYDCGKVRPLLSAMLCNKTPEHLVFLTNTRSISTHVHLPHEVHTKGIHFSLC